MAVAVITLALVLVAAWVFAPPAPLPAQFALADCRHVALLDDVSGLRITGAEDMALTPSENEIYLTAHDRRDPARPSGGLYSVSLFALEAGEAEISAQQVYAGDGQVPFRPHGLALSSDGTRLALVNRPGPGEADILIGFADGLAWAPEDRLTGRQLCRANDLDFSGPGESALDITLDRADCSAAFTDLLPGAVTGRTVRFDSAGLTETGAGLAFPNGIADGYVAETRGRRVRTPDGRALDLPGGPDNLNWDQEGWLVAAVHPKLLQLWLYRAGWTAQAPSRIVRVDPADGELRVLFDDVDGALYSGATSAIYGDGLLVAGSAYDHGLLVCQEGAL